MLIEEISLLLNLTSKIESDSSILGNNKYLKIYRMLSSSRLENFSFVNKPKL